MRTRIAGATQQTFIHFSATQTQSDSARSKPRAGYVDALAAARIENCFGQAGRPCGKDLIDDPESLKVKRAFRRDEFTAKLRTRKFFLLCQQHARAARREVNRGAGARWPATSNDYVIIELFVHLAMFPFFPDGEGLDSCQL